MLHADVEQLHNLATILGDAAKSVDALEIRSVADKIGEAFPGTSLGRTCSLAGEVTEGAYLRCTWRLEQIARKTTECATRYETTDGDFAEAMDAFDVHNTVSI